MVAPNIETISAYFKETETLRDSYAVVANGYFNNHEELSGVKLLVSEPVEGSKYRNVKTHFDSGTKSIPYLNIMIHNSQIKDKKLVKDKYGKWKMSVSLPKECRNGFEYLAEYVFSELYETCGDLIDNLKNLVYSDKAGENHWIYVEYDEKDKYLDAVLNGKKFEVDEFNKAAMKSMNADIVLGAGVSVWKTEDGTYDYSLKFKIVNIKTDFAFEGPGGKKK